MGRSFGGFSTKIHICADAHGNPIDFEITEGEIHDYQVALQLMDLLEKGEYFIANKGYDSDTIRQKVKMIPVILRRINNDKPNPEFDPYFYKLRHLLENLFARLKYFRSITTSFEKLAQNFKSFLYLACAFIWLTLN